MKIDKTLESGKVILALEGRLDTTSAPQLEEVLIPYLNGSGEVTLDFSQVSYISSAGLRVLLIAQKQVLACGSSMSLSGVSEEIMEVFEMTGFNDIITIV